MEWILRNHIKTRREFKIFYGKGIGVLLEITSGNIEKIKIKELVKGDEWGLGILKDPTTAI